MTSKIKVLQFNKSTWNQPIVCKLASDYGLTFNILKAVVLPRREAQMVLEIIGDEESCRKGLRYLKKAGVKVSPIESGITRDESTCLQCGACTGLCPTHALFMQRPAMRVQFDPALCIACGWCIKGCPARALQLDVNNLI